jgi:AcrR family transcriptional regulator
VLLGVVGSGFGSDWLPCRNHGASVFAQRGYHAASVEEIAAQAGFSKGAVYANFPTKERLFLAVWDRQQERLEQTFEAMTKPGSSTIDAMGELAQVAAPTDTQAWQWGLLRSSSSCTPCESRRCRGSSRNASR